MVATKKSAAKPTGADSVGEAAPAKKPGGWAKGKTAAAAAGLGQAGDGAGTAPEQEFDPSRIAGIVGGKSGAQLTPSSPQENAQFEASTGEIAGQQGRPTAEQPSDGAGEAADAAPKKTRAPAKAKTPAVSDAATTQQKATISVEKKFADGVVTSNLSKELIAIIESVETMMEEKAEIGSQITEKMGWAKGQGYNPVMIRKMIVMRAQDPEKRKLLQAELETYANAVGIDL